jgi:hypothetical protein
MAGLVQGSADHPPQLPAQCIDYLGKGHSKHAGIAADFEGLACPGVGGWHACSGLCGNCKHYCATTVVGKHAHEGWCITGRASAATSWQRVCHTRRFGCGASRRAGLAQEQGWQTTHASAAGGHRLQPVCLVDMPRLDVGSR